MRKFRDNIVGLVGLIACVSIGLLDSLDNTWVLGPQRVVASRLDATLASKLVGAFVDDPTSVQLTTFRVQIVIRLVLVGFFAAALWARTSPSRRRSPALDWQLLSVQVLIALIGPTALIHVVAAELAIVLPRRAAWNGLAMLIAADFAVKVPYFMGIVGDFWEHTEPKAVTMCIAWDTFLHPVFFGMGLLFSAERLGRAKLARAHAELLATQQLLADTVRNSERVRIARDLHDALGHHLTALNLHLELATRRAGNEGDESLRISRELARRVLAEVRATVSNERTQHAISLRQALETLCAGIPFPTIALSYDEKIEVRGATLADTIFRTVQEAITNVIRHSRARKVNVNLKCQEDGVAIWVSDDGCGAHRFEEGNGISGIRERIEALGGHLRTATREQAGFSLHVWLPSLATAS